MIRISGKRSGLVEDSRALTWPGKLLIGYFVLAGTAVVVLWIGFFADGTASTAAFDSVVETGISVGRVVGVTLIVASLVTPVNARSANRVRTYHVAMAGLGGLGYASLNTLGEGIAAGSHLSIMWAGALPAAVVVGRRILHAHTGDWRLTPLVVAGLATPMVAIGLHALWTSSGNLLRVGDITAIPIKHYLAELSMASLTLVGLDAWARGRTHGRGLALAGMGAYVYSTLNAIDWAVANDITLIPILAMTLVAAAVGVIYLSDTSPERR